jgi:hypothetical protein
MMMMIMMIIMVYDEVLFKTHHRSLNLRERKKGKKEKNVLLSLNYLDEKYGSIHFIFYLKIKENII